MMALVGSSKKTATIAGGVVLLAGGIALAATTKTSPASTCADLGIPASATWGNSGRVMNLNADGTVVYVGCPLVRTDTTNTTGLTGAKAYVHRTTANASNKIECLLYSTKNATPANGYIVSSSDLSVDGTGELVIDFTTQVNASINTTGNAAGFYNLYCILPTNGDWLYGYSWTEP
jgi:hypothetical protein